MTTDNTTTDAAGHVRGDDPQAEALVDHAIRTHGIDRYGQPVGGHRPAPADARGLVAWVKGTPTSQPEPQRREKDGPATLARPMSERALMRTLLDQVGRGTGGGGGGGRGGGKVKRWSTADRPERQRRRGGLLGWFGIGVPIHESNPPLPDSVGVVARAISEGRPLSGEDYRRIAENVSLSTKKVGRAVRRVQQAPVAVRRPWEQPKKATPGRAARKPERGPERRRHGR